MKVNYSVKGAGKVIKQLNDAVKHNDGKVGRIVKRSTSKAQAIALRRVPVDTGFLKRSILMKFSENGLRGEVGPTAYYAPYLEFGTRFMEKGPYPFMRPAFAQTAPEFEAAMRKYAKQIF